MIGGVALAPVAFTLGKWRSLAGKRVGPDEEEVSDVLRQPVKLSMVKVAQLYMSVIFTLIVCGVLMFRFHEEFTWVRPASPVPLLVRERWQEVPARR